jgi:hypothetical protein
MRRMATPDGLRSTPPSCLGRDAVVFPEADAAHRAWGAPTVYCLAVGPARVTLIHEAFSLPDFLADPLRDRYAAYLDAWPVTAPVSWPRQGVGRSAFSFSGSSIVTVRRDDAATWIRLLRDAASECWLLRDREPWLRRELATLSVP